jgi:hypothetical protein
MLWSFHYAPSFDESHPVTNLTVQSAQRIAGASWPITTTLRTFRDALREGLAACRQYEHLRSRGIPHDGAVGEALGIGLTPSHGQRPNAGANSGRPRLC